MNKCFYYQAQVPIRTTNLFVAAFRFYEHVAFDRTLDASEGIFEFFVPADQQDSFLHIMQRLESLNLVHSLSMRENRL